MSTSGNAGYGVGPVLHATPFARSVVSVIEEEEHGMCSSGTRGHTCACWSPGFAACHAGGARGRNGLGRPVPR